MLRFGRRKCNLRRTVLSSTISYNGCAQRPECLTHLLPNCTLDNKMCCQTGQDWEEKPKILTVIIHCYLHNIKLKIQYKNQKEVAYYTLHL